MEWGAGCGSSSIFHLLPPTTTAGIPTRCAASAGSVQRRRSRERDDHDTRESNQVSIADAHVDCRGRSNKWIELQRAEFYDRSSSASRHAAFNGRTESCALGQCSWMARSEPEMEPIHMNCRVGKCLINIGTEGGIAHVTRRIRWMVIMAPSAESRWQRFDRAALPKARVVGKRRSRSRTASVDRSA